MINGSDIFDHDAQPKVITFGDCPACLRRTSVRYFPCSRWSGPVP